MPPNRPHEVSIMYTELWQTWALNSPIINQLYATSKLFKLIQLYV